MRNHLGGRRNLLRLGDSVADSLHHPGEAILEGGHYL